MGLKPDLQGGTGFNLLRVQFWTPGKGNVFPEWSGGSSFGPFIVLRVQFWFDGLEQRLKKVLGWA